MGRAEESESLGAPALSVLALLGRSFAVQKTEPVWSRPLARGFRRFREEVHEFMMRHRGDGDGFRPPSGEPTEHGPMSCFRFRSSWGCRALAMVLFRPRGVRLRASQFDPVNGKGMNICQEQLRRAERGTLLAENAIGMGQRARSAMVKETDAAVAPWQAASRHPQRIGDRREFSPILGQFWPRISVRISLVHLP